MGTAGADSGPNFGRHVGGLHPRRHRRAAGENLGSDQCRGQGQTTARGHEAARLAMAQLASRSFGLSPLWPVTMCQTTFWSTLVPSLLAQLGHDEEITGTRREICSVLNGNTQRNRSAASQDSGDTTFGVS